MVPSVEAYWAAPAAALHIYVIQRASGQIPHRPSNQRLHLSLLIQQTCSPVKLTLTAVAPPFPNVDSFRSAFWTWQIVMGVILHHGDICRTVQGNKWEIRQIDLVDLVENLLTLSWIADCLLLGKEFIQCRVAVLRIVTATEAISSGRNLVTGKR